LKKEEGAGFRHLHVFNLVMLRKQGWNLMTDYDTIVSKVYKGKYFPSGNFLDASLMRTWQ